MLAKRVLCVKGKRAILHAEEINKDMLLWIKD